MFEGMLILNSFFLNTGLETWFCLAAALLPLLNGMFAKKLIATFLGLGLPKLLFSLVAPLENTELSASVVTLLVDDCVDQNSTQLEQILFLLEQHSSKGNTTRSRHDEASFNLAIEKEDDLSRNL